MTFLSFFLLLNIGVTTHKRRGEWSRAATIPQYFEID